MIAVGFGAGGLFSAAQALTPEQVDQAFSTVTVLTAVTATGEVRALKNVGMVAFFSPLAADLFAKNWRQRQPGEAEFRVAPLALTTFEAAYLAARQKDEALQRAYLPDPAQIPAVVGLLQQQGVQPEQARTLARQQPYVLCPDPLVRITSTAQSPKRGTSSRTVVPCAFSFTTMGLLVNQSNATTQRPTVLKAYSLKEMVRFLSSENGEDASNLVINSPIPRPASPTQAASPTD
ncbi:hypothetical protein [Synechococcus sp. BS56D]|uniref:hypothetical protein n=1 Tax=Synechococcus sp. BS56D TaxID=2055944 RepID=UPI001F0E9DBD|nr:hypothetical protein [Synechococcus sp. BS56D]